MAKPTIGHVDCPCCGESADVREQKNGRAYMLCNSPVCGFQGFTRSEGAHKSLTAKMRAPGTTKPAEKKGIFDGFL